ncbi:hypothetical protein FACS1894186_6950 [Alphaproteobacteria bacterium]|nr:hypothetical protein FACS1894186_6950 [Alphaproteobacteria bacterium]
MGSVAEFFAAPASWPLLTALAAVGVALAARVREGSARKRLAEVSAENRVFSGALEFAPDGFFMWRADTGDEVCSRRTAVMLGLPLGRESTFSHLLGRLEQDSATALASAVASMRAGETAAFSLTIRAGGRASPLVASGSRVAGVDGTPIADMVWFAEDSRAFADREASAATAAHAMAELNFFRKVLDALPLAVWVRDSKLTQTYANRPAVALTLPDMESRSLAAKARAAHAPREATLALDGGAALACEAPLAENAAGEVASTIGWSRPLTPAENQAARAVADVRVMQALLEYLDAAVLLLTPDMRVRAFNSAYLRLWSLQARDAPAGLPYDSLIDRLAQTDALPPTRDLPGFKAQEAASIAMAEEGSAAPPSALSLSAGRTVSRTVRRLPDGGGYALVYEDISEKTERQRLLAMAHSTLQASLELAAAAVAVFGAAGRLEACNRAFRTLWDIEEETASARPLISEVVDLKQPFFPGGSSWNCTRELMLGLFTDASTRKLTLRRKDGRRIRASTLNIEGGGIIIVYQEENS